MLNEELKEIKLHLEEMMLILVTDRFSINGFVNAFLLEDLFNTITVLSNLTYEWNDPLFNYISQNTTALFTQYRELYPSLNSNLSILFDQIEQGFKFANQIKPSTGLQFTLADIAVAMSLDFFRNSLCSRK